MSRKRFRDVKKAGQSRVLKFRPWESWRERHERRLKTNLQFREHVEQFCIANDVLVSVSNGGHHWKFSFPAGLICEWWPSSAKFIKGQDYRNGIHVLDYQLLLEQLTHAKGELK